MQRYREIPADPPGDSSAAPPVPPELRGASSAGARASAADVERSGSATDEPTRVSDRPVTGGTDLAHAHIEGYELHEEVHRGGQGIVFRATQLGTKRKVALKVLLEGPFASDTARRRFEREIELAASLRHPAIVTILDSGVSEGRYYCAMEFIEGDRLDRYLARVRPNLETTLRLFVQICDAVNFAHQRGVIHRDLKPSNILIDNDGAPHVLDFGLAKADRIAGPHQTTVQVLSTTGQVIGTLAYMSPEQAAGSQDVDVRTDVYSLGVIFYEALLGQTPYVVSGPLGDVLSRIAKAEPQSPRSLRSRSRFGKGVSDELGTILLRALEKEPQRRYQSAGELGADLRRFLAGDPIEAKRASGFYVLKKTLRRYRLQAAVAGLILLMLVTFLGVFAVLYTRESYARTESEQLRGEAAYRAEQARTAAAAERQARLEAERATRDALQRSAELRRALVRQQLQAGDLSRERGDLIEARDRYWDAYADEQGKAASLWALRQYYLQTGDNGAHLISLTGSNITAVSSDGRLAAAVETPGAITVRDVQTGRELLWVPTASEPLRLGLAEDGTLVAVGARWSRLWEPGQMRPRVAAEFDQDVEPRAIFATVEGGILLVESGMVRYMRGGAGEFRRELRLPAQVAATPAFHPLRRQLAVPTQSGVELVTLSADGRLATERVWSATGAAPRAVSFAGEDLLAVLGTTLDVARVVGGERGEWVRLLEPGRAWDFFDLQQGVGLIVFGTRSGELAVYRNGALTDQWRVTQQGLSDLWLRESGDEIVTVDRTGSLTRWAPPSRKLQRDQLLDEAAVALAVSRDGSTALLQGADGGVYGYRPGVDRTAVRLTLPGLREFGPPRGREDFSFSLSYDGREAIITQGSRLWFRTRDDNRAVPMRWGNPRAPVLRKAVISGDGEIVALYAQSAATDLQIIDFRRTDWHADGVATRPGGPPVPLIGSTILDMRFLPGTRNLLVSRSNGTLVMIQPELSDDPPPPGRGGQRPAPAAWATLESPAELLAFDRSGAYLAAACSDGVVRVLAALDTTLLGSIRVGQRIASLDFNASGDVLLVRLADGTLDFYEVATLERIVHWTLPTAARYAVAGWVGDRDSIAVGMDGAVFEHRFHGADALIERNRDDAALRRIGRSLQTGEFVDLWAQAEALQARNPEAGRAAQTAVLETFLRRPSAEIPAAALDGFLAQVDATTAARLGHSAYAGGRFAAAADLLRRAVKIGRVRLDAYSAWRLAECEYLFGNYVLAGEALSALADRPDLAPADLPRVQLQRLAALSFSGRLGDARLARRRLDELDRMNGDADPVAMLATLVIGNYLTGNQGESQLTANFRAFLSLYEERWLYYGDDIEFFVGELARSRGDLDAARSRYQRCIDVSRDAWPANWARFRLHQLREQDARGG